jgi:hypothetical protein
MRDTTELRSAAGAGAGTAASGGLGAGATGCGSLGGVVVGWVLAGIFGGGPVTDAWECS